MYLISSYENVEKDMRRRADKNRKIYNGMLKTYYYQFIGPKPPMKKRADA
jgi:putative N6-adenine-specific DNA methylase